jgi:hypothetical protein
MSSVPARLVHPKKFDIFWTKCTKASTGLTNCLLIEPSFIANLYPFNVQKEQVWHYGSYQLYTLNPAIYHLLKHIEVNDEAIILSDALRPALKELQVSEADYKVQYIFKKLSNCLIFEIVYFEDLEPIRKRNRGALGFTLNIRFTFENGEGLI